MKRTFSSFVLLTSILLQAGSGQPQPMNRLLFGGDVMLSRHVYRTASEQRDPAYPFREIAREFAAADIAFVNLESPFAASGPFFENRMVFRTNPSMIDGLKLAGIDVVSTANNHARDAGAEGLTFTLDLLERNGIAAVGTGVHAQDARSGAVVERKGVRFGFLAYTFDQRNGNHRDFDPRVAMINTATLGEDIRGLLKRSDTVIVSMHAGFEYVSQPNLQQQQFARAAIDAGASVVVGHHPHVTQPVEHYKEGVIFHSLGNLVFDQFDRSPIGQGAIAEVIFAGPRVAAYLVRDVEIRNTVPRLVNSSLAGR